MCLPVSVKGLEMSSTPETTAENSTLFEIDTELEAAFDAASQEQEQTCTISDETKQRCIELFAELGKKVDRIARYVRATEMKARAAKEEAARLAARQRAAENRVEQVKSMLAFFMHVRGLRRLEGGAEHHSPPEEWASLATTGPVGAARRVQPDDDYAPTAGVGARPGVDHVSGVEEDAGSRSYEDRAKQGTAPRTSAVRQRGSWCSARKRRTRPLRLNRTGFALAFVTTVSCWPDPADVT